MYVAQRELKWVSRIVILLLLPLLSGCGVAFSPEQAAVRAVVEGGARPQPNPATVKVLQTQAWQDNVMVLVTFSAQPFSEGDRSANH